MARKRHPTGPLRQSRFARGAAMPAAPLEQADVGSRAPLLATAAAAKQRPPRLRVPLAGHPWREDKRDGSNDHKTEGIRQAASFLRHGGRSAERLGFVRLLWSKDQMARVWKHRSLLSPPRSSARSSHQRGHVRPRAKAQSKGED